MIPHRETIGAVGTLDNRWPSRFEGLFVGRLVDNLEHGVREATDYGATTDRANSIALGHSRDYITPRIHPLPCDFKIELS